MAEFRLLGEVELLAAEESLDLGPPKQRALFAALTVDAGRPVTVSTLVDRVWNEQPPAEARNALYAHIMRIRRVLARATKADGSQARLDRCRGGYLLDVDRDLVDLHRFRRTVEQAREPGLADARRAAMLREALGLWRGTPLDGISGAWAARVRESLRQHQVDAVVAWARAELRLGNHDAVIGRVREFVDEHPLVEPLTAVLMRALHAAGRVAEALDCYSLIAKRLVAELGVDPGPELRQLHLTILNGGPAPHTPPDVPVVVAPVGAGPPPRQLPLDVATFVHRDRELARVGELLQADSSTSPSPVVVIHGAPGAGKSALAVRAATLWSARFPDGQLYVNLHGATPGVEPLSSADALGRFLRALRVAAKEVPHGVEEASAMFRTLVAGRRVLILLDNAATVAQVRPLLAGGAVVVTSRASLAALDGSTHLQLGPLSPEAAHAMLDGLVGNGRTATDLTATRRLAELCDHLPLGLHVAASRLKARPSWAVHHLVDRLADERHRLTELAVGDLAVRSSLGVSHTALRGSEDPDDRAAARALSLLGLLRMPDIELSLAALLFGTTLAETDRILERLTDAHLVEEGEPGRYHLHDLVRLFAHELAAEHISTDEGAAVLTQVLSHYLATARRATGLAYPHRAHYPVPHLETAPRALADRALADRASAGWALADRASAGWALADRAGAHRWLEDERANMMALIRQTLAGPVEQARLGAALAIALHWFFVLNGYTHDHLALDEDVLPVAARLDDRRFEAYLRGSLSAVLTSIGRFADAGSHMTVELSLCRQLGDRFGEQRALGNLGTVHLHEGRPVEAIIYLEQQLQVALRIDAGAGVAFAHANLGIAHHQLGRSEQAVEYLEMSVAWYARAGDSVFAQGVLAELGQVYIELGRLREAVSVLGASVEHARKVNYRVGEATTLARLARAWRLLGVHDEALSYATQAVTISEPLGGTLVRAEILAEYAEARAAGAAPEPASAPSGSRT